MQTRYYWTGLVALVFLCSCASQQDIYTLDHRIAALERHNVELDSQNRSLEKNISDKGENLQGDENDLRGQYAELAAQLQAYRDEAQLVSGRLDEVEHRINLKQGDATSNLEGGATINPAPNQDRVDQIATDLFELQKRMNAVEQYLGQGGGKTPPPAPTAAPAAAPAAAPVKQPAKAAPADQPESDAELYVAAKKAFDKGDMTAARNGFTKLITDYPKSQQADNAQYWIAETYYHEKWYEKAILEYQKVIENYAGGNKVPAAMLKQAYSFSNIGETNNARLILKEIVANYPGTSEAEAAKKKLESM